MEGFHIPLSREHKGGTLQSFNQSCFSLIAQVVAQASVAEGRRERLHRLAVSIAKRYKAEGNSASQVIYFLNVIVDVLGLSLFRFFVQLSFFLYVFTLQWGSEYWTSLVFEWSQVVYFLNVIVDVFGLLLYTCQPLFTFYTVPASKNSVNN